MERRSLKDRLISLLAGADIERLRQSEEENRAILNNVIDGIITIDDSGTILRFNPAAEKIFGYTHEEAVGQNVTILMSEPHRSQHNNYIKNYLTTGKARIIGIGREVQGRRKDGSLFPLDLAVGEMRLDGRRMFTGVLRDISDRKALERQKSDFYAMVTHDIKSPLTVIMGYAEMLLEDEGRLDGQSKEMAEGIGENAERILGMLEEFLTISRLESGKFVTNLAPEDIPGVVSSVYKQFLPIAQKKNIRLETEVADDMGISCIDRRYLGRAVSNLVQNALKFTGEGGEVKIKAARTDGFFVISVSDTGSGIPAGELGRIFEKYYRSPNASSVKGSGLGLAIVKTITEAHGGRVEVESEEGKGSTFRIFIPVRSSCPVSAAKTAAA